MWKKWWMVAILLVVLLSLSVGVALAQEGEPPDAPEHRRGRFRVLGEVTAVNAARDSFEMRTRRGRMVTFQVDETTVFRGQVGSLAELEVGMKAGVSAQVVNRGEYLAHVVVVPDLEDVVRFRGEVIDVDLAGSTFQVQDRSGEVATYAVDENTRFRGAVGSLDDLAPGQLATGAARLQEGETPLALVVFVPELPRPRRFAGQVVSVDLAASTFDLSTRRGESLTFVVDAETRFHSPDGEVSDLSDLEPGMRALVGAQIQADGTLLARHVLAASHSHLEGE